jgi:hypothetical protein
VQGSGSLPYKFGEPVSVPGRDVLEINLKARTMVLPRKIGERRNGALLRRRVSEHGAYCGPVESTIEDQGH